MAPSTPAQRMEHVIRTYIQACNDADAEAIAASCCPEAVHYAPASPKWVGAATIGNHFAQRVRERGQYWTVDQLVIDVDRCAATLEWTRFDPSGIPVAACKQDDAGLQTRAWLGSQSLRRSNAAGPRSLPTGSQ